MSNGRSSNASVPVAASAPRAIAKSRRSLDLERAEMRIAAHQHDFEHRVVERECVSCGTTAMRRASSGAGQTPKIAGRRAGHAPGSAASTYPDTIRSSVSCPSRSGRGCRQILPCRASAERTRSRRTHRRARDRTEAGRTPAPGDESGIRASEAGSNSRREHARPSAG